MRQSKASASPADRSDASGEDSSAGSALLVEATCSTKRANEGGQPQPTNGRRPHRRPKRLPRRQRAPPDAQPPLYPVEPHSRTLHGDTCVDDYHWLSNRKDPRVRQLIDKENAALERFFAESHARSNASSSSSSSSSPPLRMQLFREMRRRWKEDDASLPTVDRGYWYYTRLVKNAEYPLFCRRPCRPEAGVNAAFLEEMCELYRRDPTAVMPSFDDEVVILDVNLLVQELKLPCVDIGEMDISPDESQLAVTLDCSQGREVYTLFIISIQNVDYAQWLARDSDAMHRAWAKELERMQQSVYQPLTPASSLSMSSPASSASAGGGAAFPRQKPKGALGKGAPRRRQKPSEGVLEQVRDDAPSAGSSPASPLPAAPPPRHSIKAVIDIFDLSSEVLWVSPTSVMYIAVDDKMRKHQVVYHDLAIEDASDASFLVFEEEEEAFWVGSLGFSADDAYVSFCTSSTEVSEWFAVPVGDAAVAQLPPLDGATPPQEGALPRGEGERRDATGEADRACANRTLTAIPVMQERLLTELAGNRRQAPREKRQTAPGLRFSSRAECHAEYDLDHHKALLAASDGGAWVIVGNPRGWTNYGVFVLSDAVVRDRATRVEPTAVPEGASAQLPLYTLCPPSSSTSTADLWQPLLAYDEAFKVEGVENYYHFLLICVRRNGHPTTLFCPVQRVWRWWAHARTAAVKAGGGGGECRVQPMSLTADTVDLSTLLAAPSVAPLLRRPASPSDSASSVAQVEFSLGGDAQGEAGWSAKKDGSGHPPLAGSGDIPEAVTSIKDVRATPLRFAIECYAGCTSYHTTSWRMSVSHILHPLMQLQCTYRPPRLLPERDATTAVEPVRIEVRLLKRDVVNGVDEYRAEAYDGAVLWVPSDYYVASAPHASGRAEEAAAAALWVPTQEPSPFALVPVTMCWRRDLFRLGGNPMVVHVYGGYGDSDDPEFSTERLSLLDRGVAWAYAAVRGGGELGIPWRDAGRKLQRATTVNDYLSVLGYLQDTGLCRPGRLIGCGGSAGGVAVCRAMHQAPHLLFAVVGSAPFVDCLTSLLDDDMPLSVTEREEFGDPVTDAEAYALLKALSPVDTVEVLAAATRRALAAEEQAKTGRALVPHVLLQASWEDTRVGYWEPMKLTASLRAKVYRALQDRVTQRAAAQRLLEEDTGTETEAVTAAAAAATLRTEWPHLFFCCDFEAGHAGSSGRYEQLREVAREYAFILYVLQRQEAAEQERLSSPLPPTCSRC